MHLILCSFIDPKKHTTELSYSRAEFMCFVVVQRLPIDLASYIYQVVRAKALQTDAQYLLPYGILLTQFLHAMMVPEGIDEPRAFPLGSINKTTLSKSMAQTHRVLSAARAGKNGGVTVAAGVKGKVIHRSGDLSMRNDVELNRKWLEGAGGFWNNWKWTLSYLKCYRREILQANWLLLVDLDS
ncbi:hypothetical protein CJ030_MR3G011162 [Morella rubra]|uniref:Uncharacterized protein n=1 Tax=Morella rubra TaxID=262757 RepID=A0A6A1W7A8_9ROSI|nr:hypothetical protein CJ030_MR3G011162 [Morella rubra]